MFSGGRVAFLDNSKVKPGDWVMAFLKIKKGMSVIFCLTPHDGSEQQVALGRSVFDLVKQVPKIYSIDTT